MSPNASDPGDGRWTHDDLPAMDGETVVVTGANSGLGLEATRAFARVGARVVMACRSTERGHVARADVEQEGVAGELEVRELDLADLDSVRAFADGVDAPVDALCNNAGVMAIPRSETADGFETQFGVNHLGHFALTGLLLDRLAAADGEARVVTQSSGLHEDGEMEFDDLQGERDYDKWDAYARSKLANVLFGYELDRRLRGAGVDDVTSVVCHPGYAATNLQLRGPEAEGSRLRVLAMKAANTAFAQSPERGVLPMLYAATSPALDGGEYVGPGGFRNMRGYPAVQESSPASHDEGDARRLWGVSEDLTGVTYDFTAAREARADGASGSAAAGD
ncbi:oxidoreductase [Candidatus Halobonum tyrrellensis]|uniref:Short-chain dehydrogenase/reductase SDR n=1 Tax=Candidatus Halobonum tyrrellensis G22 TaxID=1324957 RepID=V4GVL3_9EURY|nr:oxidoreductase [Candidatus Halobonum tyrrellensis]ESP89201.1 short-chain dehydrogenase/reductase SDR [Candidatus Halobonum tyrrellensis G22]